MDNLLEDQSLLCWGYISPMIMWQLHKQLFRHTYLCPFHTLRGLKPPALGEGQSQNVPCQKLITSDHLMAELDYIIMTLHQCHNNILSVAK